MIEKTNQNEEQRNFKTGVKQKESYTIEEQVEFGIEALKQMHLTHRNVAKNSPEKLKQVENKFVKLSRDIKKKFDQVLYKKSLVC